MLTILFAEVQNVESFPPSAHKLPVLKKVRRCRGVETHAE